MFRDDTHYQEALRKARADDAKFKAQLRALDAGGIMPVEDGEVTERESDAMLVQTLANRHRAKLHRA